MTASKLPRGVLTPPPPCPHPSPPGQDNPSLRNSSGSTVSLATPPPTRCCCYFTKRDEPLHVWDCSYVVRAPTPLILPRRGLTVWVGWLQAVSPDRHFQTVQTGRYSYNNSRGCSSCPPLLFLCVFARSHSYTDTHTHTCGRVCVWGGWSAELLLHRADWLYFKFICWVTSIILNYNYYKCLGFFYIHFGEQKAAVIEQLPVERHCKETCVSHLSEVSQIFTVNISNSTAENTVL